MNLLEIFEDWDDIVDLKSNQEIFSEQTPADVMYVILKGDVEMTLHGEPLGMESAGGIVGEMAMINSSTRSASATTLTKVRAARLDRDQFREMIRHNPDFALHVMAVLANRLRAINEYVASAASRFR